MLGCMTPSEPVSPSSTVGESTIGAEICTDCVRPRFRKFELSIGVLVVGSIDFDLPNLGGWVVFERTFERLVRDLRLVKAVA